MILRSNPMIAVVWLAFLVPGSLFAGWYDGALGVAVFLLGGAVLVAKPSPWEARRPSAQALQASSCCSSSCTSSPPSTRRPSMGSSSARAGYFELLRYVFLGTFVVYLIRHFDAKVRTAVEWAMTASLYCSLLYHAADPQGYVAVLTLGWMLFFSRLRLRFLHAATAVLVVLFSGDRAAWAGAFAILTAGLTRSSYRELARRRVRFAARWSLASASAPPGGPGDLRASGSARTRRRLARPRRRPPSNSSGAPLFSAGGPSRARRSWGAISTCSGC